MAGMSFDEAKAKRDSMPAWKVFEDSLKSGGVAGTISRGGAAAISGARNRLVFRGGGSASSGIKVPNPFTSRTIGNETASGQTGMFKPADIMTSGMRGVIGRGMGGRVSNPSPPFKGAKTSRPAPKARVKALARHKELREKAKANTRYGPNTKMEQYVDDLFGV